MSESSGNQPNFDKNQPNPSHSNVTITIPVIRNTLTTWLLVNYVLIIFFPIVAIIIAYVKRGECQSDSVLYSHVQNQIKICWIAFIGYLISILLSFIIIGVFTMLALAIWIIYKVIKGFSDLQKNNIIC